MLFLKTFKDAKSVVDGIAFQTFITLSTKNFCLMLAVHLGLNSLYWWPLVLVLVLSAKKSSKFTFTKLNSLQFCKSTTDPDAGEAVLGCKVGKQAAGNPWCQSGRRKGRLRCKDLQKMKFAKCDNWPSTVASIVSFVWPKTVQFITLSVHYFRNSAEHDSKFTTSIGGGFVVQVSV